jgi:hypothetical protein
MPLYDGASFAAQGDVVVVTINYRLGALGFLYLEELAGDRYASPGNNGLLSMNCLLLRSKYSTSDGTSAWPPLPMGQFFLFGPSTQLLMGQRKMCQSWWGLTAMR